METISETAQCSASLHTYTHTYIGNSSLSSMLNHYRIYSCIKSQNLRANLDKK